MGTKHWHGALAGAACAVFILAACGGGGGDGGGGGLSAPAFTNLAGTRWNETDTVSAANSCGVAIGFADPFVLHVLSQSGNSLSVYDERAGVGGALGATISGYAVTFSGDRFPVGGCATMTAVYSVTLNTGGTSYSGTATITCHDGPVCTVPVTVTGTKI